MPSYDEKLLASAPKATKAQLQDGYNSDLLAEKPSTQAVDPEAANRIQTPVQGQEFTPFTKKKGPFYTTKKGIIIIVVLVVAVIIAAVVGGVVGSRNKSQNSVAGADENGSGSRSTSSASSSASSSVAQGFEPNTSIAGSAPTATSTPASQGPATGNK